MRQLVVAALAAVALVLGLLSTQARVGSDTVPSSTNLIETDLLGHEALSFGANESDPYNGTFLFEVDGTLESGVTSSSTATEPEEEFIVSAVPIPTSILLFLSALAGFGFMSRRRSH